MKNALSRFLTALFIIIYTCSCLLVITDSDTSLFSFNSLLYQAVKLLIVFLLNFIVTLINRKNIDTTVNYCFYCTIAVGMIFAINSLFVKIIGPLYNRIWWMLVIHIAFYGVYTAVFTIKNIDFKALSLKLMKGYSVLYAASFVSIFARTTNSGLTTNFEISNGTIRLIPYLIDHPGDWEIWFLTLGNVIFFVPIAFILKALIPKIKAYQLIIVGAIIPVIVEGYQLIFKCGDVDIDDYILNFCGFMIGFILLTIQSKIKKVNKA